MNHLRKLLIPIAMFALAITGCQDEDFDAPPHQRPEYAGEANITLADFKAKHNELLEKITDNDIIEGVITANDVSGNLYKQIFIEDETGGLMVAIDRNNIYNDFRVGQKIFIETKDLYMGKYGGLHQLGYQYSRNNDGNFSIGQMTWEQVKRHVFKDDYPQPELVTPKPIDYNDFSANNYSRLVKLEGVFFEDDGEIFSYPPPEGGVQTLNRVIIFADDNSKTITARMSSAANFAADTIPAGVGSVTGVLTVFNTTVQLLVRDSTDLNFEPNPDGWGIQSSPWSVSYALQNMDAGKSGWVKGYIVGAVKPGVNDSEPISENGDISFEPPFLNNTLVIAQSPDETNWENLIVVNLPPGSPMRALLNLSDNESNLGKEVAVAGSLETILAAAGVKVATGNSSEFMFGGEGEEILNAPFQNTLDPFTAHSVTGAQQWSIDSYGYAKMTGFDNPNRYENEDWLISPAIDLTDYDAAHITFDHLSRYGNNTQDHTLWISADYSGGDPNGATWTQINIDNYSSGTSWDDWTNSGNLNIPSEFTGKGNIHFALKYISTASRAGTWEVKNMRVVSGPGDGGGTVEPPDPGTGDGSKENPYNIQAAVSNQGATGSFWTKAYIVGAVDDGSGSGKSISDESRFTDPFTVPSNLLIAATPGETDYTNCIPVQLPPGTARTALNLVNNPDNLGKEVNLYGTLETYYGVPGIKSVSDFVLDEDGVEEPPPPPDAPQIFLETFGEGQYPIIRPKIADFDDFDNPDLTWSDPSGNADVRTTPTTDDAHVWFPANVESGLTVEGIDISQSQDVKLQFDLSANGSTSADKLLVKINGEKQTVPGTTIVQNIYSTIVIDQVITASSPLKIEFIATTENNTVGFRLDNIKLTGNPKE